ncbi:MAG: hypothetical protein QM706_11885 [Nitrospira sp.]
MRLSSFVPNTRTAPVMRHAHWMFWSFFRAGVGVVLIVTSSFGVQNETREEKAANLRKQAVGGLFQNWTFDRDLPNAPPSSFVTGSTTEEPIADWAVHGHATAPSPPNVVAGSSRCAQLCFQMLLADGLEYEYPDLSIRFHAQEGTAGVGGMVFGVRDARNFYAVVIDPIVHTVRLVGMSNGQERVLGQASVNLKPVDWHTLRLQRNTIISKDFIEVFVDGTLTLSVEDQALGVGQVGLVVLGASTVFFDNFHAVPLFSHRPLSAPPAY